MQNFIQPHLSLRVSLEGARIFLDSKMRSDYQSWASAIWSRDAHRCYACSFQAEKHQEVVPIASAEQPDDWQWVTACIFCAHTMLLNLPNVTGRIVYLPEITQVDLNNLVRVLFCLSSVSSYSEATVALLNIFSERTAVIENWLGAGHSHPMNYTHSLFDIGGLPIQDKLEALKACRFLPALEGYQTQINYWRQECLTADKVAQYLGG